MLRFRLSNKGFGLPHIHTNSLHQFDDSTVDGLDHFYSFESAEFKKRVPVISMAEFIELEAKQKGLVNLDPKGYERVLQLSLSCENRRLSE